jgi:hypothetical protein
MRGINQVKERIKCMEGCHVVERRNFHSFSNHVPSDNEDIISASWSYFLLPLHMSTDEGMTPMHTTMIGAWNGVEEVQQRFPSQERGLRLIRFESPRWRPKAIQVRVQFGVQEQCAIKRTPRSHMESVLDVLYMVGSRIL